MLTILHGDDISQSRKYFSDLKQKAENPETFEAENLTVTDLLQSLSNGGLFSEERCIFIENFLTKSKKLTEYESILQILDKHAQESHIVLWEGKEIDRKELAKLKKATPRLFKLPQLLFTFLDALKPGNSKRLLPLFHDLQKTAEPELLFFMLIRQFRILLAVKEKAEIDEIKRLAPWQRQKLEQQAKSFQTDQLITLYTKLFEIDNKQKTGKLLLPLTSTIDFFLMEI